MDSTIAASEPWRLDVTAFLLAGKVTALQTQKRNKKRVNIYLDDQYAFALADIEATRLKIGQWLDDEEIKALQTAGECERAYSQALNFLSYRPRSAREVRRNLHGKGYSPTTIDAALERLERTGLVNDLEFGRYWIEQRESFRPRGAAMLRYELAQKGIDREIIATLLDEIDEDALAYQAAQRWARPSKLSSPETFNKKLSAFLARRGFRYATVRETVSRIQDELNLNTDNETS